MKKNNLIFFLLLVSFTSFSQNNKNDQNELKEFFLSLPDSVFKDNRFFFPKEERQLFWNQYKKGEYRNIEMSIDKMVGEFDLLFENDFFRKALIDEKDNLIRIMKAYSDAIPTYEIKIFQNNPKIIGLTLKYYDNVTIVTDKIVFYEYKNKKFKDDTKDVLESFNFYADNYSEATVDSLSKFYSCDFEVAPKNKKLLYRFTESDTVFITYDFFDYYYFNDELLDLHQEKHGEEFYMKKYIMDNGRLRLAK